MEQIKKEIEADPYGVLFGRRLEPFSALNKFEDVFASFYRSLFGLDKAENFRSFDTTAHRKTAKHASAEVPKKDSQFKQPVADSTASSLQEFNTDNLEFDPISGRMVPKGSSVIDVPEEKGNVKDASPANVPAKNSESYNERTGYLSSIDRPDAISQFQTSDAETPGYSCNSGTSREKVKLVLGPEDNKGLKESHKDQATRESELSEPREVWRENPIETSNNEFDEHKPLRSMNKDTSHDKCDGNESFVPPHLGFNAKIDPVWTNSSICDSSQHTETMREENEKAEDLDILNASDIRSSYISKRFNTSPESQKRIREDLDDAFDAYVDPASDIDIKRVRGRYKHLESKQQLDGATTGTEGSNVESFKESHPNSKRENAGPPKQFELSHSMQQLPPESTSCTESYCVLAYDPSTHEVTQAEAMSSLQKASETPHPSEVLSRLNNLSKFLPYFAKLNSDGYEIVSGSGDVLVFRKVLDTGNYDTGSSLEQLAKQEQEVKAYVRNEPLLDEESVERSGLFLGQRPEQEINASSPPRPLGRPSASDEESFPKTQTTPNGRSRIGQVLRRMFISGVATAATCYALGVVGEYFRTGGQDGLGIDAFTEFESERRRREAP
ncbi:hypothetical protein EYZ11_001319 [Aspergillus tanneri]|nr:hypothetical protein EYZ11_001319 [Aspergillus tanneri]